MKPSHLIGLGLLPFFLSLQNPVGGCYVVDMVALAVVGFVVGIVGLLSSFDVLSFVFLSVIVICIVGTNYRGKFVFNVCKYSCIL